MASKSATAARISIANASIDELIGILANGFGVDVPERPTIPLRDPAIRAAYHSEHVAGFLKSLAVSQGFVKEDAKPEPEPPKEPEGVQPEGDDDHGEGEDLDALTVKQLKARAKAAGVEHASQLNKAELIEALQSK